MIAMTCLGGTLARVAPNQWQWSDGTPEPAVADLSPSQHYNFRCQNGCVEVPLAKCQLERDVLGWVLAKSYRQGMSGDHTGERVLHVTESYGEGDIPGISTPDTDMSFSRRAVHPDGTPSKRAIPKVALVPIAEWDAWAALNPYGATWSKADEPAIFAKARSLGWKG